MPSDLEADPASAVALCLAAHARLTAAAGRLRDDDVRAPSRLPDWTVGRVLTHLARNADGHTRRLEGALLGEDVRRYPGGPSQRNGEIEAGAARSAGEIIVDLDQAQRGLEQVWERSAAAGWPHSDLLGDDHWPTTASPVRRLREVEIHHVDLGIGYEPWDWPDDYVAWELPALLATVPKRLGGAPDARALVVWLTGRGPVPTGLRLQPW